jgi:threonine synthase
MSMATTILEPVQAFAGSTEQFLKCRLCGAAQPFAASYVCEECFGPLEVAYDYEAIRATVSRERIEAGPRTLWRYRELLPDIGGVAPVDIGAGCTPLLHATRLGTHLGLSDLWVKNDAVNPTYSFKDRAVSVATTIARGLGIQTLACASTGNLAGSVAAHAAKAGVPSYVFIPADLEEAKILGAAVYGTRVVTVEGAYDDVNRLCTLIADEYGWGFVNVNLRPFYAEGAKTLAYEVAEAFGWQAPDHIIAPMASGSLLVKIAKGFRELAEVGLIEPKAVRVSGAQAWGCSPIVEAYLNGSEQVVPQKADTIAKSLAIGTPADGHFAISEIQGSDGRGVRVTDQEIIEGIKLLARTEGLFTETAGGVTVAGLKKLVEQGDIERDERVVIYITGNGLKTPDAVAGHLAPLLYSGPALASFESALGRGSYRAA